MNLMQLKQNFKLEDLDSEYLEASGRVKQRWETTLKI